jgi:hypothetical protein
LFFFPRDARFFEVAIAARTWKMAVSAEPPRGRFHRGSALYQRPTGPQIIGRVLDGGFELFNACLSKVFVLAGAASLVAAPINLVARYFARNAPGLAAFPVIVCGVLGLCGSGCARADGDCSENRKSDCAQCIPSKLHIGSEVLRCVQTQR